MIERENRLYPVDEFEQLRVGDSIFGLILTGWMFVGPVPDDVADAWLAEHFQDSIISRKGLTPSTGSMKVWEVGIGVVVATPTAMLDGEKLNLLYKAGQGDVRLYLSTEMRKKRGQTRYS